MCLYFSRSPDGRCFLTGEITKSRLMGNKDAKVQCRIASLILKSNLKREAFAVSG